MADADCGGRSMYSESGTVADFIDCFVTGDGEPSLPEICDIWLEMRFAARENGGWLKATLDANSVRRHGRFGSAFAVLLHSRFYEPEYANGRIASLHRTRNDVPATISPCVIRDLDSIPLPTRPIVPYIECVHDRIAIEIMRGCPHLCRFCQSTVIKRPLRTRSVETIVNAALESYRNTGFNEISILSLSSSDYPHFEALVLKLKEVFGPMGVNISVPSLRVNEQLRSIAELVGNGRRSGLTLAPEVARDDMREQIRKKIKNDDLYEGCKTAFKNNYESVKLYFLCGLPGERPADLMASWRWLNTLQPSARKSKVAIPR